MVLNRGLRALSFTALGLLFFCSGGNRLRQQRIECCPGYADKSICDDGPDCAIQRNRDIRQCETFHDARYYKHGDLDLQRSCGGDHKCLRRRDRCKRWDDHDYRRRNRVQTALSAPARPSWLQVQAEVPAQVTYFRSILFRAHLESAICRTPDNSWRSETYSAAPVVRDITNYPTVTWISSFPSVFPVNNNTTGSLGATAGIVTAYGNGSALITVEAKNSDGSLITAEANFNCPLVLPTPTTAGTCYPGSQTPSLLATITVYNEGLNTTNWLVTAPSATGTPNVLNCGPGATGGSVCVATYPVGTTVTLTAPATGAAFGGWSYNCANIGTITATGPNSCTVTLLTNDTVGAIFN